MSEALTRMLAFILEQDTCVLATSMGDLPHTSLMAYLPAQGGRLLYLLTSAQTHKFRNLSQNPRLSLLIDNRSTAQGPARQALTVSGQAQIMGPSPRQEALMERFAARHPDLAALSREPDARVIQVTVESLLLVGPEQALFERLT